MLIIGAVLSSILLLPIGIGFYATSVLASGDGTLGIIFMITGGVSLGVTCLWYLVTKFMEHYLMAKYEHNSNQPKPSVSDAVSIEPSQQRMRHSFVMIDIQPTDHLDSSASLPEPTRVRVIEK
jgi:hypothetical protein